MSSVKIGRRSRLFLTGAVGGILLLVLISMLSPKNDYRSNSAGPEIEFLVKDGELGSEIAQNLEASGIIKSAEVFIEEFTANPAAKGISPGAHIIETMIPVKVAIEQLLDVKRMANRVEVREGSTLSDVIAELKKDTHIVNTKANLISVPSIYPNTNRSLEGSLFPAFYSFASNTPITKALSEMSAKAVVEYRKLGLDQGYGKYSAFEVLTIASMVQVEGDPDIFGKVAQVIYNRLKIGMPLQLNSTIQYATNTRGNIMLSNRLTQINSLHNTYRRTGLPPTPISNPSKAAIEATLKPTTGDWLYFITVAPRNTRFTKDFKEFSNWNTEFNKNVAAGVFK